MRAQCAASPRLAFPSGASTTRRDVARGAGSVDVTAFARLLGEPPEVFRWSTLGALPSWLSAALVVPQPRLCFACLAAGYHTALFSIALLDVCPIHGMPLVERCHCGATFHATLHSLADYAAAGSCRCGRLHFFYARDLPSADAGAGDNPCARSGRRLAGRHVAADPVSAAGRSHGPKRSRRPGVGDHRRASAGPRLSRVLAADPFRAAPIGTVWCSSRPRQAPVARSCAAAARYARAQEAVVLAAPASHNGVSGARPPCAPTPAPEPGGAR